MKLALCKDCKETCEPGYDDGYVGSFDNGTGNFVSGFVHESYFCQHCGSENVVDAEGQEDNFYLEDR